jgi:molybdopterin/thiamine biosynthesis adenylyltransferase
LGIPLNYFYGGRVIPDIEENGRVKGQMKADIRHRIRESSKKIFDSAGRETKILEDRAAQEIAAQCGLSLHEVYRSALGLGVCPYRYIRNRDILSTQEQLKLAVSQVAVVGAGGLGGQVVLLLARVGVGRLIIIDGDLFDETNLNRQALCGSETLGKSKAKAALDLVASINPAVLVVSHPVRFDAANIDALLTGSDVIVDALDNVADRLILQEAASRLGVPMVHGDLAGFEGRVMTIYPGDAGTKQLYGSEAVNQADADRPEVLLGVPAVTAALIGTLQAMEVLKILLKRGHIFRNAMAYFDLESAGFEEFNFDKP